MPGEPEEQGQKSQGAQMCRYHENKSFVWFTLPAAQAALSRAVSAFSMYRGPAYEFTLEAWFSIGSCQPPGGVTL